MEAVLAVVDFFKKHCHPDAWTKALTRPKSDVEPADVFPDSSGTSVSKWTLATRETASRRCFAEVESSVSSLAPSLSRASPACTRTSRFQTRTTSRRLHGKRSRLGIPSMGVLRGKGLGLRTKECDFGGRQEVYRAKMGGFLSASLLEQSGGAGVAGWLVLHSGSIFPSREDQERLCPVSGAASPSQIAARLWVRARPERCHARVHKRRSWCGQSQGKPRKRARKLQDIGASAVLATAVPVPVTSPEAAKRPLVGGESKDTTDFGAVSPTLVQDCNQTFTQVLLFPSSQRLDALQPPLSPVLADIAAQLQVLMASVQSIATAVGQLSLSRQRSRR